MKQIMTSCHNKEWQNNCLQRQVTACCIHVIRRGCINGPLFEKGDFVQETEKSNAYPNHVAIIMDGNGRWAKKRFLPTKTGHKAGAETLKMITREAEKIGIKFMTVYAFSTENWKRSQAEINDIMDLLREYLKLYIKDARKDNIKVKVIGNISRLDSDIIARIEELEEITKDKPGLTLLIALNYGGRDDILRAVKTLIKKAEAGDITANELTEEHINQCLDLYPVPDPELLIRSSGEFRISNFLLWNLAYTELYFTDVLWPDFTKKEFMTAINSYNNRDRRFGGKN